MFVLFIGLFVHQFRCQCPLLTSGLKSDHDLKSLEHIDAMVAKIVQSNGYFGQFCSCDKIYACMKCCIDVRK